MNEQATILDKHGDVKVRLKGQVPGATTYTVCSRALARASPVLRAEMRHHRAANDKDAVLQICGSDDESLAVFLNIAHSRFLAVPRTLTVTQMHNLTTLMSAYKCTAMLAPWIDSWMPAAQGTVRRSDIFAMFWVYWDLGLRDELRKMAHRVVVELDTNEVAVQSTRLGRRSSKTTAVMDRLSQIRSRSLQALLATTSDVLERLLVLEVSPRWSRLGAVRGGTDPGRCRLATCARLRSLLQAAALWPLPEAADVRESVVEVYSKLAAAIGHDHMGCEAGRFWCRRMQEALNAELDLVGTLYEDYADVSEAVVSQALRG
ncbi:hypothetical protein ISF_07759 [Cordyceps fumosorosea ARSEF 2679]|uniref:BTB domain-containing protein n=1 Tax=Cordyceps fumosorosea (strain ARSEF 2679) TaxID=1081104 RepID=A0A167NKL4_CORFA|nr:hypothetical protein ISF_07759 [Cordyceps fumosorosea ARSEF 2679]OAA55654.1 hypothetical protein ISF_07759 [Cordyceps fumosorosea ARSEF 2679]